MNDDLLKNLFGDLLRDMPTENANVDTEEEIEKKIRIVQGPKRNSDIGKIRITEYTSANGKISKIHEKELVDTCIGHIVSAYPTKDYPHIAGKCGFCDLECCNLHLQYCVDCGRPVCPRCCKKTRDGVKCKNHYYQHNVKSALKWLFSPFVEFSDE